MYFCGLDTNNNRMNLGSMDPSSYSAHHISIETLMNSITDLQVNENQMSMHIYPYQSCLCT